MSISAVEIEVPYAENVRVTKDTLSVDLSDGRTISVPLALAEGATARKAYIHVGLLTGIFAVMQFLFAPLWGRWSDRIGRRPGRGGRPLHRQGW